ncbi:hypothetical protein [Roseateles sp.]|uniref:hypothetical protein n=1 Tax=Roseateles sp. TaxID=1971397 RepID=UPI0039E7C023
MNFQHAFVSMICLVALIGLAFVGISVGHALKLGNLALVAQHPLFGSGIASLSTATLGSLLLLGLGRPFH